MESKSRDGVCRVKLHLQGRVQGVGFRYFVRMRAKSLQLDGWVRNERDGSVTLVAEGPRNALEQLRSQVRNGPPSARVDSIEEDWEEPRGDLAGFSVMG